MGYAISWLAVQGVDPDELLDRLGVRRTGEDDEYFEGPMSGGVLKQGGYLVVANGFDHPIVREDVLAELSQSFELLACGVEEHVMYSSAAGWRNGKATWSLVHDASRGIFDLQVSGEPPAGFAGHRERCLADQDAAGGENADVDYFFEIPLLVAKDLTGFKHDEDNDGLVQPLEALEPARKPSRSRWRLW